MNLGPTEWFIGAAGAGLIVAGVLNVTPLDVVRRAVSGGNGSVRPIHTGTGGAVGSAPAAGDGSAAGFQGTGSGGAPSTLVDYRNPVNPKAGDYSGITRKMTAATRDGLEAWGAAYGQRIVITDGWRSTADQARGHAQNPNRYAAPGKSWHERGTAVDVHLAAVGADNELGLRRLHAAGEATGWCFHGKSGPMHASFGGCG